MPGTSEEQSPYLTERRIGGLGSASASPGVFDVNEVLVELLVMDRHPVDEMPWRPDHDPAATCA
jgi:hypothetical protein